MFAARHQFDGGPLYLCRSYLYIAKDIQLRYNYAMEIVRNTISLNQLQAIAQRTFGDMVKAVIDVDQEIIAIDAELHSDLEAFLLENGSKQKDLWGINLYPDAQGNDFVEFDSMINIRPSQGNRSRGVDDASIRTGIIDVVDKRIQK